VAPLHFLSEVASSSRKQAYLSARRTYKDNYSNSAGITAGAPK